MGTRLDGDDEIVLEGLLKLFRSFLLSKNVVHRKSLEKQLKNEVSKWDNRMKKKYAHTRAHRFDKEN